MNKELIPTLRFKEFANEWSRIHIQDLIDKKIILSHLDGNHGGLYPRSDEFTSSGVPYISANDFYDGQVDFKTCKHLPEKRASQFKKGIAKDGDVLFAHNATVGPTALLETKLSYVILSTTATYFRCDNKRLLNRYLRLFFETKYFIQQYSRIMAQSTRNQVPITAQRKFTVALPEFNEQNKIASFLNAIDEKIRQLTRKKGLLEQYKKGVMQQLFSGKLRFKDENGKAYPKWTEKKLGDVLSIGSGRDYKHLKAGNVPVFGTGGYMLSVNEKLYSGETVFIGRKGSIDKPFYFKGDFWTVDTLFYTYQFKDVLPLFIYATFQQINWKLYNEASGVPSLSKTTLEKIKLNIPALEEQQKIANFLTSIDAKIESVKVQISHTQMFKKGLLQQMLV